MNAGQGGRVSLNRSEQMIYDYLQGHPDERHHWQAKVRSTCEGDFDAHAAAERLQLELWAYFVERSAVVEPFRSAVLREGVRRISMRNLAEHLIRLWIEPRLKRRSQPEKLTETS